MHWPAGDLRPYFFLRRNKLLGNVLGVVLYQHWGLCWDHSFGIQIVYVLWRKVRDCSSSLLAIVWPQGLSHGRICFFPAKSFIFGITLFIFISSNSRIGHLYVDLTTGGTAWCVNARSRPVWSDARKHWKSKSFSTARVGGHGITLIMVKKTFIKATCCRQGRNWWSSL